MHDRFLKASKTIINDSRDTFTGSVSLRGRVSYVAQQAWIQNATIKDNILFGNQYDEEKYKKVSETFV